MEAGIIFGLVLLVTSNVGAEMCKSKHGCKLEPLGCFSDRVARTMPEEILNERDASSQVYRGDTIDWMNYESYLEKFACRCAQIAAAKGYTVIGLQFYGECWSGPNAHLSYDKYGKSPECIDGKFKEHTNKCVRHIGRSWTNFVYRIDTPGCSNLNIQPVGCFHDDLKEPRPLPTYLMTERDYRHKSWNGHLIDWANWKTYSPALICRCATAAKKAGQTYFSIQFWGECWSGTEENTRFNRNGGSTECVNEGFKPCPCKSYNCIGKAYTNYVYKLLPDVPCPTASK